MGGLSWPNTRLLGTTRGYGTGMIGTPAEVTLRPGAAAEPLAEHHRRLADVRRGRGYAPAPRPAQPGGPAFRRPCRSSASRLCNYWLPEPTRAQLAPSAWTTGT